MKRFGFLVACLGVVLALAACQPIQPPAPDVATPPAEGATEVAAEEAAPTVVVVEEVATEEAATEEAATEEAIIEETTNVSPLADLPDIVPVAGFTRLVHDPVIAEEDGEYYVFHSGPRIAILKSPDMVNWEFAGRVFDEVPDWVYSVNPDIGGLWAPDISYFNDKWHIYYSASSAGSQNSGIGFATNSTLNPNSPDYKWEDQGMVFRTQPGASYNAIDPNIAIDDEGNPWLVWGSYWQGLYMRRLNANTGHFDEAFPDVVHVANRSVPPDFDPSLEGAFIIKHGDYFYLFASFDHCCIGSASDYNVRVGRSEAITGPYLDRDGVPMLEGGGTKVLQAYDRWRGPGHHGFLLRPDGDWIVYHAYDSKLSGAFFLRIERMHWDDEGWPWYASQESAE